MSELYICIDCELTSSEASPAPLNIHGLCATCGSSSVVPVDTLLELDKRAKAKASTAPPPLDAQHALRVQATRDQRKRDAQPLVSWLKKKYPLTTGLDHSIRSMLHSVLDSWDGWAWHVDYPWDDGGSYFTIELIQGVKNGPRWLITLSSEVNEVRSFQDGTELP